jgi:hypothetical protein
VASSLSGTHPVAGPQGTHTLDAAFLDESGEVAHHGGAFTTHLPKELWAAGDSATLRAAPVRTRTVMRDRAFSREPRFSGSGAVPVKARR